MFLYKETAFGLWGLFWLHQGGIPRHTCRFHCCLAAHQRTRKKDSAEPSFPILWTPPHPPGVIRCGGACRLPRVWSNIGSCIQVQVARSQFGIWCSRLCSTRYRSRFSRFHWAYFARFSLLVGWTVRACGYVGFLPWLFVGFALTAVGSFVLVDTVMEYQIISSLNRTNALYNMAPPSLFGEMDLHRTKLEPFRGQR